MIFDKIENLDRYREFAEYGKLIRDFIKQDKSEHLAEGRYELDGENLFALVQTYETKDKDDARMEAHRKYADLQFMEEGEERIYVDFADELEMEEDRTPDQDILFYKKAGDHGFNILTEGTFGYYAPQDAHMPCIKNKEKQNVRKIVFKIAGDCPAARQWFGNQVKPYARGGRSQLRRPLSPRAPHRATQSKN